jgi:hypothetical protein
VRRHVVGYPAIMTGDGDGALLRRPRACFVPLRKDVMCRGTFGGAQGRQRERGGDVSEHQYVCTIAISARTCSSSHELFLSTPGLWTLLHHRRLVLRSLGKAEVEAHRSSRDRRSFVPLRRQGSSPKPSTFPSTSSAFYNFKSNHRQNSDQFNFVPIQSQFHIPKDLNHQ